MPHGKPAYQIRSNLTGIFPVELINVSLPRCLLRGLRFHSAFASCLHCNRVRVGELCRISTMKMNVFLRTALTCFLLASACGAKDPIPKTWPLQFHAQSYQNNTAGEQSIIDLWYDHVNGRNLNIIQHQLGNKIWDVEWNNGTSYYFDLEHETCNRINFPVGILRPNFLEDAHYVGVRELDGFTCNVWEKEDFITYYEDVRTQRPVAWLFFTGMFMHIMTFEEGAVLSDPQWQAPSSCFENQSELKEPRRSPLLLPSEKLSSVDEPSSRWLRSLSRSRV
ncbi:hypothetical protein MPTK1_4g01960 [Marchantia polymorpha subsp. ruderalis]|uniref:Uncharacterized protein n=3 Tax=Marchantia polymorpha TaxID=3197 RepID=A0AAF6B5C8_MARPO|nr:hypothetical protein MARPO_0098s0003 [Marchantia polymorpha]BBN07212.1 hypothetical protein Mp_4g01960 [Marchantia polymorpha subsp. ruderalis]|eukprot:PTQ32446.1 hypothetical protein MARPO_0098s0003 [Marchantia polymorpha]